MNETFEPGDEIFVYDGGPGLVTRLDGWALSVVELAFGEGRKATIDRRVCVFRNEDGRLDISSPLCVVPLDAAANAWHLVAPDDGRIVGGGTKQSREELEALRNSGKFKFLAGSAAVHGLPDGVQYAPAAGAEPDRTGSFTAARGGWYVWYEPANT